MKVEHKLFLLVQKDSHIASMRLGSPMPLPGNWQINYLPVEPLQHLENQPHVQHGMKSAHDQGLASPGGTKSRRNLKMYVVLQFSRGLIQYW